MIRTTLLAACLLSAAPGAVCAAPRPVTLSVGEGRLFVLPGAADAVTVARPEVADVQAPSPASVYIFGKAPGRSGVAVLSRSGGPLAEYDVTVQPDTRQVQAYLAGLPNGTATVRTADGAIVLEGSVATPAQADAAASLAKQAAGGKAELVQNRLSVAQSVQVALRVRIAEVSRSVIRELGFNLNVLGDVGGAFLGFASGREIVNLATNTLNRSPSGADAFSYQRTSGRIDLNAVVDALAGDGLVTILAEPNLVARSGETASFLSGGEFPIPIDNQNNSITVQFKKFGVALDFTPTVLDGGRISIHVRPEVSQLDPNSGVEIRGLRIPGLSVRRAETTVELGSGQSFAIAGLIQANSVNNVRATPFLGDIPILGALFRSTRFQRNESELVIMVTPYLVEPANSPRALSTPLDRVRPSISFESLFLGRVTEPDRRLPGETGFIVE